MKKRLILVLYLYDPPISPKNEEKKYSSEMTQKNTHKINFSVSAPCDDEKTSIPKIENYIVILHYGLQRRFL